MLTMRVKKVAGRMQRLQRLRRVVGRRATAVFRTGVIPAMTYGSPVCGASPTEIVRMEGIAANGLWPRSRGTPRTTKLSYHRDPLSDVAIAAI